MDDEQRPWQEWEEYVTLGLAMQKAHEYDSPSFLRADVDVALDALCARVWREAQKAMSEADDVFVPMRRELAERADAAEAQRDRLAAAGQAVCDGVLKSMTGIPLMWLGEPALAVRPAVIDALRAALADVPDALARQVEEA